MQRMNTNLNRNSEEMPDFDSLFELSPEEDDKHEARMIMYRFLSEIERVSTPNRGLKKRLADAVGKSKSFITQLFNGDRLLNLTMLAKFQKALGIKFKIIAYPADEFDKYNGHQQHYTVNVFVPAERPIITESGNTNSNAVVQIQILEKAHPIHS